MTKEELITAARNCASDNPLRCSNCPIAEMCGETDGGVVFLLGKLADALKNKPRPVNYSGDGYANGELVYDMAECPNCGRIYFEDKHGWEEPFCSKCGQQLSWS